MILDPSTPIRALPDPRLVDIEPSGISDLHPPALLILDLPGGPEHAAPAVGAGRSAEPHAAAGDGEVAGLLELPAHLARHLLLAVAHLRDGLVDGLADDLVRQVHQLLGAGGDQVAAGPDLLLGGADAVPPDLARRLLPRPLPHHLRHLLLLPPDPPPRVRVQRPLHVLADAAGGRGRQGLRRTPAPASSFSWGLAEGFSLGLAVRVLDLLVEDRGPLRVVGELLEELLLSLSLRHLVCQRLGRGR